MSNRLVMALKILTQGKSALDEILIESRRDPAQTGNDNFTDKVPSPQNIVDLYQGEWSSALPGLNASPASANLFDDPRIRWMNDVFGIAGKSVLELGPLEAAHTRMMCAQGAKSITSIEGNNRAFQKCLCVKELFDLHQAKFLLGNFARFLAETNDTYDVAVASGVLYHMTDPIQLLHGLTNAADRVFIWTHYFDAEAISGRPDKQLFSPPAVASTGGFEYTAAKKSYSNEAITWGGFSGGIDSYARWLFRDSLLGFFEVNRFAYQIAFDEKAHPNGPAIAICATRIGA